MKMNKTTITVREVDGRGFWVEVASVGVFFLKFSSYLKNDGSLETETLYDPWDVIQKGLFATRLEAAAEAHRFALIARLCSSGEPRGVITVNECFGGDLK